MIDDQQYPVILFWDELKGQTWYGKKLAIPQSDVRLHICKAGVTRKLFKPNDEDHTLQIQARSGDTELLNVDASGQLTAFDPAKFKHKESSCEQILLANKPTTLEGLQSGGKPSIAVLCESTRQDRHPKTGIYQLSVITQRKIASTKDPINCPP